MSMKKKRNRAFWAAGLALLLLMSTLFSSCAVIDSEDRHLTHVVDALVPKDDFVALLSTSPLWITAGIITLIVDGWIINPVVKAPAAVNDATTISFMGFGLFLPAEIVLIVPRGVGFAVIFVGSDIARCSVPYIFK